MNDPRPYYRVGRHNPQNVYRHDGPDGPDGQHVGVFFTPDKNGQAGDGAHYARLAVHGLNAAIVAGAEHGAQADASEETWSKFVNHPDSEYAVPVEQSGGDTYTIGDPGTPPDEYDPPVTPRYVWLVASALQPGSRMHAVPAVRIREGEPTYREIMVVPACRTNEFLLLVLVDDPDTAEFTKCVRCTHIIEQETT